MQYKTVAFSGTSLTSNFFARGWQVDAFERLHPFATRDLRFYDLGYPGRISADGLADVNRLAVLRPDIAVFEYAMNDAYTPAGVTPIATFKSNLGLMVDAVRAQNPACVVFLMTMNPAIAPGDATVPNLLNYYQGVRDTAILKATNLIDNTPLWGTPSSAAIPDGIHPVRSAVLSVLVPSVVASLAPFVTT